MAAREYRGESLVVTFDKDVCIHAAECVRSLPAVFDVDKRPWIQPDNAAADQVRDVVAMCPSGALEVKAQDSAAADATAGTVVKVMPNGPLIVEGDTTVCDAAGTTLRAGAKIALCRCGASANKPFCDGSHAAAGFAAD